MKAEEKIVGMGKGKGDMKKFATTITKALDSEIIYAIGLVNELLKHAGAKICITAEKFLDAVDSEEEKGWVARLGVKGGNVVEVKAKTLEPFADKMPTEMKITGIYINIPKNQMGFFIE